MLSDAGIPTYVPPCHPENACEFARPNLKKPLCSIPFSIQQIITNMYKIAAAVALASMLAAASIFRTFETSGLFAITWIGALAYTASIVVTKAYISRS